MTMLKLQLECPQFYKSCKVKKKSYFCHSVFFKIHIKWNLSYFACVLNLAPRFIATTSGKVAKNARTFVTPHKKCNFSNFAELLLFLSLLLPWNT